MSMDQNSNLEAVLRGFAALVPPSTLSFPTLYTFDEVHKFFLHSILLESHFQKFSPSTVYQQSFWKWAIERLESEIASEDDEVDSRIYEHYLSLLTSMPQASVGPPPQSYITHYWQSSTTGELQKATLLESRTTIERGTTGLRSWRASFVLAEYLIGHPELVRNQRVFELGAGSGFLGIVVASLQLSSQSGLPLPALYLTDVNEQVLHQCKYNVSLSCNRSSCHTDIHFRRLDWSDSLCPSRSASLKDFLVREAKPDLFLGADLIYDPSLIPPLVAVIELALQSVDHMASQRALLLALTIRNLDTFEQFMHAAQSLLHIELIQYNPSEVFLEPLEVVRQVKILKLTTKHITIG